MTKTEAKEVLTMIAGKQKDIPLEQVFKVIDLIDDSNKYLNDHPTNIQWPKVIYDNGNPLYNTCTSCSNDNETKGVCCERK